jgi:hypothetical protein
VATTRDLAEAAASARTRVVTAFLHASADPGERAEADRARETVTAWVAVVLVVLVLAGAVALVLAGGQLRGTTTEAEAGPWSRVATSRTT